MQVTFNIFGTSFISITSYWDEMVWKVVTCSDMPCIILNISLCNGLHTIKDACEVTWNVVNVCKQYRSSAYWFSKSSIAYKRWTIYAIKTSLNGNIFCVTGPLCWEFTGNRCIPLTKASDAELWCFLWSAPEQTAEKTIETPVIWDAFAPIMTSLWCTYLYNNVPHVAHLYISVWHCTCAKQKLFIHHLTASCWQDKRTMHSIDSDEKSVWGVLSLNHYFHIVVGIGGGGGGGGADNFSYEFKGALAKFYWRTQWTQGIAEFIIDYTLWPLGPSEFIYKLTFES